MLARLLLWSLLRLLVVPAPPPPVAPSRANVSLLLPASCCKLLPTA